MGTYTEVIAALPRLVNQTDAIKYCCLERVFKKLCSEYGLLPVDKKAGSAIYDLREVDMAIDRMKQKEREV